MNLIPQQEEPLARLMRRLEDGPVRMPMEAGGLTIEVEVKLEADGTISVKQLTLPSGQPV